MQVNSADQTLTAVLHSVLSTSVLSHKVKGHTIFFISCVIKSIELVFSWEVCCGLRLNPRIVALSMYTGVNLYHQFPITLSKCHFSLNCGSLWLIKHVFLNSGAAGQNKQHVVTKNTAKLDRETEELHHDRVTLVVGKVIQQGRQDKGMTQKDLATVRNHYAHPVSDSW